MFAKRRFLLGSLSLTCLPSVDFHWEVCLLGTSLRPCRARLSMSLSVGSIIMPEVDMLVLYSSAIFTSLRVGSDHLCCFPCWLQVDQPHYTFCPSMPSFPLLLRELAGWKVPFFWLVYTWTGIMLVITTKLRKAIPMVDANASTALNYTLLVHGSTSSSVLSLLWGVGKFGKTFILVCLCLSLLVILVFCWLPHHCPFLELGPFTQAFSVLTCYTLIWLGHSRYRVS